MPVGRIGTIRAYVDADTRQFDSGMRQAEARTESFGRSFAVAGGLFAAGTAAFAVGAQRVIAISDRLAGEESLARAFGLARDEYVKLGLALESTGQSRDEIRDLLGDTQEILGLLSRGDELETTLFAELGLDASFARRGINDLDGAFLELLDRVTQIDRVAARGLLTRLVGADASRRILEAASAVDVLRAEIDRPLVFASEESRAELHAFAADLRFGGAQAREFGITLLGQGIAFLRRITTFAGGLLNPFGLDTGEGADAALIAAQNRLEQALDRNTAATTAAAGITGALGRPSMDDPAGRETARVIEIQLESLRPLLLQAFGPVIDEVVSVTGLATREFELSVGQAFLLGSTINTVLGAAIGQTEDWGDVILSVLGQLLNFGVGNLAQGLPFFGGGRQFGGPVLPGGSYLIGERGPEVLTIGGQGGGVSPIGPTFNISITGGNAEDNRRMLTEEFLPLARRVVRDDWIAAASRPGTPEYRLAGGG